HAFADCHAHLVNIFFAETCGFRDTHHDDFGEIHALEQRLERNLDSLGFSRHPRSRGTLKEQYASLTARAQVNPSRSRLSALHTDTAMIGSFFVLRTLCPVGPLKRSVLT